MDRQAAQTDKLTRTKSVRDREPQMDRQATQTDKTDKNKVSQRQKQNQSETENQRWTDRPHKLTN